MELVVVRDGSRTVYVERDCIREVMIHPQIEAVPGAPAGVRGVMVYEDGPLVFYRMGDGKETACGVILNQPGGSPVGIAGDLGGEEIRSPEELCGIRPGIWEKPEEPCGIRPGIWEKPEEPCGIRPGIWEKSEEPCDEAGNMGEIM